MTHTYSHHRQRPSLTPLKLPEAARLGDNDPVDLWETVQASPSNRGRGSLASVALVRSWQSKLLTVSVRDAACSVKAILKAVTTSALPSSSDQSLLLGAFGSDAMVSDVHQGSQQQMPCRSLLVMLAARAVQCGPNLTKGSKPLPSETLPYLLKALSLPEARDRKTLDLLLGAEKSCQGRLALRRPVSNLQGR